MSHKYLFLKVYRYTKCLNDSWARLVADYLGVMEDSTVD